MTKSSIVVKDSLLPGCFLLLEVRSLPSAAFPYAFVVSSYCSVGRFPFWFSFYSTATYSASEGCGISAFGLFESLRLTGDFD